MENKISIKLNATKEQIEEINRLKNDKSKLYNDKGLLLPYSKLGKYLIENFGEQIADAIRK